MAFADAAIQRMREYAQRGRIGAARPARPIVRLEVTPRAARGEAAVVAWETMWAGEVTLTIDTPGQPLNQSRIPFRGQRTLLDLPVGRTVVLLNVLPAGAGRGIVERRATIDVVHPAPVIDLDARPPVTLGETFQLAWRIRDAERAVLAGPNGEQRVALDGTAEFTAYECGRLTYELTAFGPGGTESRRIAVRVLAPELCIEAPDRIDLRFGDNARVPYTVTGAAKLTLRSPDRGEPDRLLPQQGTIFLDAAAESERLVFAATGYDGEIQTHTVSVQVAHTPNLNDLLRGRH